METILIFDAETDKSISIERSIHDTLINDELCHYDGKKWLFFESNLDKIKQEIVRGCVKQLLNDFNEICEEKIKRLNLYGIDWEDYDPNYTRMLLPKAIFGALLKHGEIQISGDWSSNAKWVKAEKNRIYILL